MLTLSAIFLPDTGRSTFVSSITVFLTQLDTWYVFLFIFNLFLSIKFYLHFKFVLPLKHQISYLVLFPIRVTQNGHGVWITGTVRRLFVLAAGALANFCM